MFLILNPIWSLKKRRFISWELVFGLVVFGLVFLMQWNKKDVVSSNFQWYLILV